MPKTEQTLQMMLLKSSMQKNSAKMVVRTIYAMTCFFSLMLGCQQKINTRAELYRYIQDSDNGVFYSNENNGTRVSLSYIPSILMKGGVDSTLQSKYLYFKLAYQINDKDMLSMVDQSLYSILVSRLSFRFGEYIRVWYDDNAEEIVDCQFSPTYGTTNNTEVIIALDRGKLGDRKVLKIRLKDIGLGLPDYDFRFEKRALDNLDGLTIGLKDIY